MRLLPERLKSSMWPTSVLQLYSHTLRHHAVSTREAKGHHVAYFCAAPPPPLFPVRSLMELFPERPLPEKLKGIMWLTSVLQFYPHTPRHHAASTYPAVRHHVAQFRAAISSSHFQASCSFHLQSHQASCGSNLYSNPSLVPLGVLKLLPGILSRLLGIKWPAFLRSSHLWTPRHLEASTREILSHDVAQSFTVLSVTYPWAP